MIKKIILLTLSFSLFLNASDEKSTLTLTCLKGRYKNLDNNIYQIEYSHSIKIKDTYNVFFKLNKDNNIINIICISKENQYEIYKKVKSIDLIKENKDIVFFF